MATGRRPMTKLESKSRPWLLWFLIVFFIWSVGKDFQMIFTLQRSVDFHIFDHHKLSTVFFAFLSAIFLLDFAASYSVIRRTAAGFWVCLGALLVNLVYNVIAMNLALDDLPGVRDAYMARREMMGLPANPETAKRIFTPDGIKATMALGVFFGLVGIAALVKARPYFFPGTR
jgi:hypothetical protein